MNTTDWGWSVELITSIIETKSIEPKKKFFFTDSQDEFVERMEGIARNSFKQTNDNLIYLEQLEKIRQIKEGTKIEDVYTWLKRDEQC